MDRGRLQPPRSPELHRWPVQPLRFPTSQASPGKQPEDRARSRFHTSDSTPPPTATCPLPFWTPVRGETAAAAGQCRDGRVVHRQEGGHRYCPGPAAIYVLRPDEHHVCRRPFDHGEFHGGRQRWRMSCVDVSEDVVSVPRPVQHARSGGPFEKRTWRKTQERLS